MIPSGNSKANIDRFLGYQNDYDRYRPEAPPMAIELLTSYLGRRPAHVADIGCGTGLSTFLWKDDADAVTGVEPNPDMLGKAQEKLRLLGSGADNLSLCRATRTSFLLIQRVWTSSPARSRSTGWTRTAPLRRSPVVCGQAESSQLMTATGPWYCSLPLKPGTTG